ncbi:hypothetical protein OV207_34610 [Corallococcus sp. BB11-1]|uniref:hypothetical protein n=1 Tax=Corallococcus sp. BB11-1 TaxID=2996783 RepID=UPI00226DC4EF|nr:hypothetical protein [Corallococcus sp. BB11-1]MCY1036621.1 hypothetical protein [Corallococcus sp. BB11-1]
MRGRWMWMGMMGLCTLASGCQEADSPDTVDVPTTMQARDTPNGGLTVPATPALAQGATEGPGPRLNATSLPGANAQVPANTAPPPGALPQRGARGSEADRTAAQAPADAPAYGGSGMTQAPPNTNDGTAQANTNAPAHGGSGTAQANTPATRDTGTAQANTPATRDTGTAPENAPATGGSGPAQAPARGDMAQGAAAPARDPAPSPRQGAAAPNANTPPRAAQANGQPATQAPEQGRVMIGAQAVQASEDEAWYEGAAKAAQAAVTDSAADRPLEQVTIATSTVNGRVTRASRDTLHVRDGEGTVYELQLDPRSRGLRQGQRVPLPELREGTPVRASFALIGGRTVARDVQVRR